MGVRALAVESDWLAVGAGREGHGARKGGLDGDVRRGRLKQGLELLLVHRREQEASA